VNRTRALRTIVGATLASTLLIGPAGVSAATAPAAPRLVAATTCTPGARACPIRIRFAAGAFSGQGHSQLLGIRSQRWFVVRARAGQTMIVVVEGAGPTRGTVFFPGGGSDGQPGGRVFDASVPRTGDYRIRVTESPMGQGWSGRVDVVVVIY
jgi:hypothetical protein